MDKSQLLAAARDGIQQYVDTYNRDNSAEVAVTLDEAKVTDQDTVLFYGGTTPIPVYGGIEIDGGGQHGAFLLTLTDL